MTESVVTNLPGFNIAMIGDSVAYLLKHFEEVIYDAEHFFDGFKKNREYALATLKAAEAAGSASITVDGIFVDYPIVDKAARIVALAERLAAKDAAAGGAAAAERSGR